MKRNYFSAALLLLATSLPGHAKADGWFACQPYQVMDKVSFIHVACVNTFLDGSNTIRYLTLSTANEARVSRFVAMSTAAIATGSKFTVKWMDSSSNVGGCGPNDCRTVEYFSLTNN